MVQRKDTAEDTIGAAALAATRQIDTRELTEKFGENRIEAIRYVQRLTGLGLRDTKDFVDAAFEGRVWEKLKEGSGGIDPQKLAAQFGERKIEAIKYVREQTGLGLKEAKDIVDYAYGKTLPPAPETQYAAPFEPGGREPHEGPEIQEKSRRWPFIVGGIAVLLLIALLYIVSLRV